MDLARTTRRCPLALLRLLAEEPRNGYQLMQAIEERSEGRSAAKPGVRVPKAGAARGRGADPLGGDRGSRRFEITDAGREHLDSQADEPAPWEQADEDAEHPLTELAPLVIQIGKATFQVASVGDPAQREQARALLADTRRRLYRILADDADEDDNDQRDM